MSMAETFFGMERGDHDQPLDIHDYMVVHPNSTFFMKMEGDGPEGTDIKAGDVLVVDRAALPKKGAVAVVALEGELRVEILSSKVVSEDLTLWGVVTGLLRRF